MELREWQYMNKPAGSAASNSSSSGYKKRFEKLIKYHIDHASSELESITHKDIKDDGFHLSEHYNTGSDEFDRTIIVSVNKYTDEFFLSIFVDGKVVYRNDYEGYEKVLEILTDTYMFLPDEGTREYDDLLTESLNEWQLMSPPANNSQPASTASSKTNKEKFAELVAYMQKHKDSSTIFTSVNGPNDTGFEYEEQKAFANGDEYNMSLEVECKSGNLFFIHLDTDGKRIATKSAVGWEDLLLKIKTHFHVPKTGSPEYKSLTESFSAELKEWKAMNPPKASQPVSKSKSQEDRYKKLIAQIDADGIAKYKVNELTDTVLDFNVSTKYKPAGYRVKIEYNSATDDFNLQVADGTILKGNDWNDDILTLFGAGAILRETDLLRESHSLADDFRLYENLWD